MNIIEIAESKGVPEIWFARLGDGFYRTVKGREEKLTTFHQKINPLTRSIELTDVKQGDLLVHTKDNKWRRFSPEAAEHLGLI
jgi:hypothetical protein